MKKSLEKIARLGKSLLSGLLAAGIMNLDSIARSASAEEIPYEQINSYIHASGANLPWGYNHTGGYSRYGWDLGIKPWGGENEGFSVRRQDIENDLAYLRSKNVGTVRVFFFCDFRTGLTYDGLQNITGVQPLAYSDMRVLLDVARTNNVKILPVLTDYTLADGATCGGGSMGEHPEFITNSVKRAQLAAALRPFVRELGANSAVDTIDIMNEPKVAVDKGIVSQAQMKTFLEEMALMIKQECPNTKVTAGHYNRQGYSSPSLLDDYGNASYDTTQIHYYNFMAPYWNYNTPASAVYSNNVFFGEVEPTDELNKLGMALSNNYWGVSFWSHHDKYAGKDFSAISTNYSNWIADRFAQINENLNLDLNLASPTSFTAKISPTYAGNSYALETCTNLAPQVWLSSTNFTGSQNTNATEIIVPVSISPRFYRIKAIF